ncbi:MAG: Ig-like domain-containing protein, partial [Oscillospiraceae bacterium]
MTRSEMINKKDKQNISKIKSKPLKEFGLFLSGIMLSFMIIFIAFIFSSCSFNVDKDSVNNKNDEKISSKLPERQSQIMNSEDVILPKVIELSMAKPKLQVGETQQLLTTVLPANATNKSVVYTTNNVEIASVSNEGMVTARNGGTCIITVKANVDLSVKKTYKVTVMPKQKQDVEPQK